MRTRRRIVARTGVVSPTRPRILSFPRPLHLVPYAAVFLAFAREAAFFPRRRESRASLALRVASWFGPDLIVFAGLFVGTAVTAALLGAPPDLGRHSAWVAAGITVVAFALTGAAMELPSVLAKRPDACRRALARACEVGRDFLPVALLVVASKGALRLAPFLPHHSIDGVLRSMDARLAFAVPSAGAFAHPLFAPLVVAVQASFFLPPVLLSLVLLRKGQREHLRAFAAGALLTAYVVQLLAGLLPSTSSVPAPLFDSGFPSLTIALATLAVMKAWQTRALSRTPWFLPATFATLLLLVSAASLYLHVTHAAGILAGFLLGILGSTLTERLVARFGSKNRDRSLLRSDARLAA